MIKNVLMIKLRSFWCWYLQIFISPLLGNTYKVGLDWRAIQERAIGLPHQQTIVDYGNRTFFPIMFTSMITRQTLSVRNCKTFLVSCYTYLIRFLFQTGESSMTFDRIWDQFANVRLTFSIFVMFLITLSALITNI